MQNNVQINMQDMFAICRFGADCLVLTVICRICQIICSICIICYGDFQYAQYAFPTLLMIAGLAGAHGGADLRPAPQAEICAPRPAPPCAPGLTRVMGLNGARRDHPASFVPPDARRRAAAALQL